MNKSLQSRQAIRDRTLADESIVLEELVKQADLSARDRQLIMEKSAHLVRQARANFDTTLMEDFLGEFSLSTKEGIALMCLAEALLRIPDIDTVDDLIADRIASSDWDAHLGKARSSLVNTSTWALMLTGRILSNEGEAGLTGTLKRLTRRLGKPVIRSAIRQAMRKLGRQFVLGETIQKALQRAEAMRARGYSYSYDMLGEAAITNHDAKRYYLAYASAITEIAKCAEGSIHDNPSISVKLSALHPRYETIQKPQMLETLVSRVKSLATLAMNANIGFNIDAEEAARLDISLDIIESVLSDSSFAGWDGFGVVVQAYSKRAAPVIDWLFEQSRTHKRKIMVRLVKGAYWDNEIKQAQVLGLSGYPVFTKKTSTDISYIACARKLLSMRSHVYPQFATHNAHTVAAIRYLAGNSDQTYEFQRLHGMGEALMEQVMSTGKNRCRIYAPVGFHKDLLAYLVRRLLENGANSSFVHQLFNETVSPEKISADPFSSMTDPAENPNIPFPKDIFGKRRKNSCGLDINNPVDLETIEKECSRFRNYQWSARPLLAETSSLLKPLPVYSPANLKDQVGTVQNAVPDDIETAVTAARRAQAAWAKKSPAQRAEILEKAANLYEDHYYEFFALLTREAGKTIADCIGEAREAVDFLRFYANEATRIEGDGKPRGIFACISPWNFPLAIFTGQIAAALATGNAVLAKPAEQTPLIACRSVQLLHRAGVPKDVLQLLVGDGPAIGGTLTSNAGIDGVCFTGSTQTARTINLSMARHMTPDAPLIAETGGLNAMIVDSSALPEQAVLDVLASAFQSAGQRCSACRILYVQSDIAEEFIRTLRGAMDCLILGDPWNLDTDIGPLIDQESYDRIAAYTSIAGEKSKEDFLFSPVIKRVSGIEEMDHEVFGPVLHVATYESNRLEQVIEEINAKGYGLTFGLHTRIDARVEQTTRRIKCGNIYVNRNQIGAVVGSQPFGGEGLSGTGPKAGGPNYLSRFMRFSSAGKKARTVSSDTAVPLKELQKAIARVLRTNPLTSDDLKKAMKKAGLEISDGLPVSQTLPGPTGESNILSYAAKDAILCLGPSNEQACEQACAALVAGCGVVVVCETPDERLGQLQNEGAPLRCLSGHLRSDDITGMERLSAITIQPCRMMNEFRIAAARRGGAIIPFFSIPFLPTAFHFERHVCIDTTATGGNATLIMEAAQA